MLMLIGEVINTYTTTSETRYLGTCFVRVPLGSTPLARALCALAAAELQWQQVPSVKMLDPN